MKRKRILVCPLDWGLGHASRDVSLIRKLIRKKIEPILGGDGSSLELLRIEFPGLEVIRIPSHKFIYSKIFPAWLMIIVQIPAFLKGIIKEHRILKQIIHTHHLDLVIADARYGLWSRQIPSVILTHQIIIKMPWLFRVFKYPVNYFNLLALRKFSQIWIPDTSDDNNLSGDLSHNTRPFPNSFYIGFLSGFEEIKTVNIPSSEHYEVVLLLSGPEPQRSVFEKKVTYQLLKQNRKSIIIGGITGENTLEDLSESCQRISFLSGERLYYILKNANYIICRAGYSTIMDLVTMEKTAFMVPTPGQTEQEYLARYLQEKGFFLFSGQKEFNLEYAIHRLDNFKPEKFPLAENLLLDEVLNRFFR